MERFLILKKPTTSAEFIYLVNGMLSAFAYSNPLVPVAFKDEGNLLQFIEPVPIQSTFQYYMRTTKFDLYQLSSWIISFNQQIGSFSLITFTNILTPRKEIIKFVSTS